MKCHACFRNIPIGNIFYKYTKCKRENNKKKGVITKELQLFNLICEDCAIEKVKYLNCKK